MFLFGSRGAYFHIGQCFKCDVPLKMFLCHLLYVCVSSDSSKHWHGSAQHFLRVLLYLGGYSLVTIGKLGEASLE
jgi:hypothetical protein